MRFLSSFFVVVLFLRFLCSLVEFSRVAGWWIPVDLLVHFQPVPTMVVLT